MTKSPTFTPGASYDRDGTRMVEVKPDIYVNETTARLKHGVVPRCEGRKVKEDLVSRNDNAN